MFPVFQKSTKAKGLPFFLMLVALFASTTNTQADPPSREETRSALKKGVDYFREHVSTEGGYLWRYAADFSQREGEVEASPTTVWVQPPGTPAVGLTYLRLYELTGDTDYLEAVRETAYCLVRGQLDSGGWDYRIEFAPEDRKKYAYRADGNTEGRNTTTLDDNTTQAALRCLMRIDQALEFKDKKIHEAARYALNKLMEAQYPNGAWPQRYTAAPDPAKYPIKPASYPEEWSRTFPKVDYKDFYTFNDNTLADTIEVMFIGAEIYQEAEYDASGRRGGDFMILAQMPDPQPGWAQQYNAEMHPAWARKFEPPAITGNESQGVMRSLLRIFELTGDRKYLEPIPRALAYYRASVLDNGQMARFYELKTNTPLYFTKDYELTYSDADMPTHYAFKTGNHLAEIGARYEELAAMPTAEWKRLQLVNKPKPAATTPESTREVRKILESQREDGAWIEPAAPNNQGVIPDGTPVLYSRTFIRNVTALAEYAAAP